MPAHQRLRLEDNRGLDQARAQPMEPDEDHAICRAQPEPRWCRPLQDNKLLAEKCHLGFASRMRSEHSDEQSGEQLQEVNHPEAKIAHRGIGASPDAIFGSHTMARAAALDNRASHTSNEDWHPLRPSTHRGEQGRHGFATAARHRQHHR